MGAKIISRQRITNPEFWRGEGEKQSAPWGIRWVTPSREYASDYGTPTRIHADIAHPLDLRDVTDPHGKPYLPEKTVQEWVEILNEKGLRVHLLEPDRADDYVSLWDIYDGRDKDYTEATDMLKALRSSRYDAMIVKEVGTSGRTYDAYGLIDHF